MTKANTQYAKTLGSIAFANGVKCAPALDGKLQELFVGRTLSNPDHRRTMAELKAWVAGWTQANLAA